MNHSIPKNRPLDGLIEFVAKSGQGIKWFMTPESPEEEGLPYLKKKLTANKGKNNIIIFNLGVNDAADSKIRNTYEDKFKEIAVDLKKIDIGCKLYYADVYPVSSATLKDFTGKPSVTVADIKEMNAIIDKICQNSEFSKIDLYDHLKKYGWFYYFNQTHKKIDGIHPSPTTSMSVYEFYLEKAGCKSSEKVKVTVSANPAESTKR